MKFPRSMAPVIGLDIDGTIADYHGHWLKFAQDWFGKEMPGPRDINNGEPLHKFMGVSKENYRKCKLAFRQGGLKRSMPVFDGAAEMVRGLRGAGAEVWLCTTRPYLSLNGIEPDTQHWLRRNHIQRDNIIFGEHKYRELVRAVGRERVIGVLDDLPALLEQARRLDLPTYLRDQPYNRYVGNECGTRIFHLSMSELGIPMSEYPSFDMAMKRKIRDYRISI